MLGWPVTSGRCSRANRPVSQALLLADISADKLDALIAADHTGRKAFRIIFCHLSDGQIGAHDNRLLGQLTRIDDIV